MATGHTTQLEQGLGRLDQGQSDALEFVIEHTCERLRQMASQMLRASPKIHRWTETDDLLQNALMKLHRSLAETKPSTARHYYSLAATQMRRELIDLARKHYGPEGIGTNLVADGNDFVNRHPSNRPLSLDAWTEFHLHIDLLPIDEKEVFELLWYEGLNQIEAARLLDISLATLKRRWQSARLHLAQGQQNPDD